ncbi:MAG: 30S ribosome-binding factor RbfA [Christensenellaceae bacterium]|jgi:ribosome-binding factor A|nr:30S ribosome-binding factor RbfA [Christensenellaceae bacterium]
MNSKAYVGRINTDIFRVLTTALQNKLHGDSFLDVHILRVEASADLSSARVYVNIKAKEMEAHNGFFRNEIAQSINLRKVPNLRFIVDDGEKNTARVEELLKQIKEGK